MIRLSYSIIDPWSKGNYDEALKRYWRLEETPTQAMIEGKQLHQNWQDEVEKTKRLPKVFGGAELVNPKTELKIEAMLEPWLQFVGVIDLMDGTKIYDYKSGNTPVSSYSSSYQIPCYQVLLDSQGLKTTEGYFFHYNQHTGLVEKSKRYLTDKTLEYGKDWILTWASEIYSSLKESGEL